MLVGLPVYALADNGQKLISLRSKKQFILMVNIILLDFTSELGSLSDAKKLALYTYPSVLPINQIIPLTI